MWIRLQDYYHELLCITEREKFIVPVRAIGARAIVDFPDEVVFPTGPVKNPNTKTLLVRNIGNRDAKFSLTTDKYVTVILNLYIFSLFRKCGRKHVL